MKNLWCHMNSISSASFCLSVFDHENTDRKKQKIFVRKGNNLYTFFITIIKIKIIQYFFLLKLN